MAFKEILNEIMYDKNIDIKTLSKDLNIDLSTIYKYFNQGNLPSLNFLIKISDYFKCSINFLLGFSESNNYTNKYVSDFYTTYLNLLAIHKLKNKTFCRSIGLDRNRIYDWKKGIKPTLDTLMLLANHFEVSIDYLLGKEF